MRRVERLIILWISGLTWEVANTLPALRTLQADGATVTTLEPLPITGRELQARQMLSGQNPAHTGYFDDWQPQRYSAQPAATPTAAEALLHKIITGAGHTVIRVELSLASVPSYVQEISTPLDCLIIHTTCNDDMTGEAIEEAIKAARSCTGDEGSFFLLSEYQEAEIHSYVNLNDALHALEVLEASGPQTIRWEETLAYHIGYGQIWLNLEGREPGGIVASGNEYNQTCQALLSALSTRVRDPRTGEPVIERVYGRADLYRGDYLFQAPDLVAVLRPGYAPSPASVVLGMDSASVQPSPAGTRAVNGLHPSTVAGLAIAAGRPFVPGKVVSSFPLAGVAPTILHALHLPVPTDMDAGVIADLFASEYMQLFPIQHVDPGFNLSSEDEEEVIGRLKSLGYL